MIDAWRTLSRTARVPALAIIVWAGATAQAFGNSILNGGFESGDLSSWTVTHAPTGSWVQASGHGNSGHDAAWFGATGTTDDELSQSFATTAGETYQLDFWLAHGWTDNQNDFRVWWDGAPVLNIVNGSRFDYTHFSFLLTALDASTELAFGSREMLDYYFLDDVSVTPVGEPSTPLVHNPEPATFALVATGLVAIVGARRRRVRSSRRG